MDKSREFSPTVGLNSHKWNILRDLWSNENKETVSFTMEPGGWYIREFIDGTLVYQLRRDVVTQRRYTDLDTYGLLGLSLLSLNDDTCYITEGVSDYFSAKLCLPDKNVLGVTNLGGSTLAKKIMISLFNKVIICSDRDPAGINTAFFKWKRLFDRFGIESTVWMTTSPSFKDFTDEFLFNLRCDVKDVKF